VIISRNELSGAYISEALSYLLELQGQGGEKKKIFRSGLYGRAAQRQVVKAKKKPKITTSL
jgi:hypothetical protein